MTTLVLFRSVRSIEPDEAQFWSNKRQGKRPRRAEITNPREHDAVSCWDRLEKLRELAEQFPQLGGYAAELHIAPGGPLEAIQEGDPGHWNVYGEPADIKACVQAVHPLR